MLLGRNSSLKQIVVYNFDNIDSELMKHGCRESIDIINIQYVESTLDPDTDYDNRKMETYYKVFFILRLSPSAIERDKENIRELEDYFKNGPAPGTPQFDEIVAFDKMDKELSPKDAMKAKLQYIKDSVKVSPAEINEKLNKIKKR